MGRCYRNRRRRRRALGGEKLSHDPEVVALLTWLKSRGWRQEKPLRLAEFRNTGRGLMCLERVEAGEVLVNIPLDLLLTRERVIDLGALSAFAIRGSPVEFSTHELLTLFLLREKNKGNRSEWWPYIKSLPKAYDVLYFCRSEEVQCFPQYLKSRVVDQKEKLGVTFPRLIKRCQFAPSFSIEDLEWAWFTVNTRAVYFEREDLHSNRLALAPFLDMFNHSPDARVKAGLDLRARNGGSVYQLVSESSSAAYDEVFINYGPHCNMKLALEYGFVVPQNSNDFVPLTLEDLAGESYLPLDKNRMGAIRESGLADKLCVTQSGLSWNAMACIFILKLPADEVKVWHRVYQINLENQLSPSSLRAIVARKLAEAEESLSILRIENELSSSCGVAVQLLNLHIGILEEAMGQY